MEKNRKFQKFLIEQSLTKYRLAQKLGVSWQTIYNWELGRNQPSAQHILAMSRILGVSAEDILKIFEGN